MSFFPMRRAMPMRTQKLSIDYFLVRGTANVGAGIGSMSPAMPIPKDTSSPRSAVIRMPTRIAITSIRAFNEDLPYDQFIIEQLAADRLPSGDPRRLAALGFLTLAGGF